MLGRILSLLEKLDGTEAKRVVLRIITIASHDDEAKLTIGRHHGFAKILRLLLDGDQELITDIVKTIKHFLPDDFMHSDRNGTAGDSIPQEQPATNISIGSALTEKFANVFGDVRDMISAELARLRLSTMGDVAQKDRIPSPHDQRIFIVTKEQFDCGVTRLERTMKNGFEHDITALSADHDLVRECLRVQGALASLTTALRDVALSHTGQLDLLEAISKLLFRSHRCQMEFREMNGYRLLLEVFFDQLILPSVQETDAFLKDCFNLLYTVNILMDLFS